MTATRNQLLILLAASASTIAIAGCDDRKAGASAPPALMAVNAPPAEVPAATKLAVRPLATLDAGRATVLAPMPDGSIFALQASSTSDQVAQIVHLVGPRAEKTPLTPEVVLQSLGIARGKGTAGGTGQFTTIAACADGRLAFSFAGVVGTRPFAAVGTFAPATKEVFVSVDFITLGGVDSELSTDVGRPSLFTEGDDAWLWRARPTEVRLLTMLGLGKPQPKLASVSVSLDKVKDVVERSAWEWSATPTRGQFLLTDTASRWIRKIDDTGTMTHVARFDDKTITTITPAALDAAGRIIILGNDRDGVATCALVQDNDAFRAITRDHFDITGLGKTAELRIDRLYAVPGQRNLFDAYEATSGRIVRVELK
jgi:hypothetical protein